MAREMACPLGCGKRVPSDKMDAHIAKHDEADEIERRIREMPR